ncbi:MAG: YeiH family protein [Erysipelotrichaceae bacterium]
MKKYLGYGLLCALAIGSLVIAEFVPMHLVSGSVFALLLGMFLHPYVYAEHREVINVVAKKGLRIAIVLMGLTLSFSQVVHVGKYSLIVMVFTLLAAFGGGYLLGKAFGMDWKLSSLISAGTGICGGSAIAAIAPTIDAEDSSIAYAISATFIFDVLMVILFPIMGRAIGMSDLGFGLWAGTAVNDTSSVVAAGYAYSDAAGSFALIVKLTRTLSIIPTVLIFSWIGARMNPDKQSGKFSIKKVFPTFILFFLLMVVVRSTGLIPETLANAAGTISKFMMVMALAAIGLKTNFKEVSKSGFKPMLHGFLISLLVVVVSFVVQMFLGQI